MILIGFQLHIVYFQVSGNELCITAPSTCLNGGSCRVVSQSEFACDCLENYSGLRCEIDDNDDSFDLDTTSSILIFLISAFILAIIIILIVIVCFRINKREERAENLKQTNQKDPVNSWYPEYRKDAHKMGTLIRIT